MATTFIDAVNEILQESKSTGKSPLEIAYQKFEPIVYEQQKSETRIQNPGESGYYYETVYSIVVFVNVALWLQ